MFTVDVKQQYNKTTNPSYRKHHGIFKIKFIEEIVLPEDKMRLISEKFKYFFNIKVIPLQ